MRPAPGTRLEFQWRKWDGSPHWVHECVYLGSDRWGDWVGQLTGWRSARPGRALVAPTDGVTLLPPTGDYAVTINESHPTTRVYIDIAWEVGWDAVTVSPVGIDMDLDVVKSVDGTVWIDDRDEWDEHRAAMGYPADIVERLEAMALDLERAVRVTEAPFDDATADRWLRTLRELTSTPDPGNAAGRGDAAT